MMLKLEGNPVHVNDKTDNTKEEIEEFVQFSKILKNTHEASIIMGDINAKVELEQNIRWLDHMILVNGEAINNIRYANDTTLITNSQEGLQKLMNEVTQEGERCGLRLNYKEDKVMAITHK
ncbi:hypothetical protein ILUMI_21005 [Ignelater luminosus]|uniref:Uncharacterized protein n=1 Tax=Ignelater luminosus TaxID=2038154 RepID=A0A8K0CJP5_IGNLU|nr:hypothetical protein ILUMI_21005 [Ignelater luminosus]